MLSLRKLYCRINAETLYDFLVSTDEDIDLLISHFNNIISLQSSKEVFKYILDINCADCVVCNKLIKLYLEEKGLDEAHRFIKGYYENNKNVDAIADEYYKFLMKQNLYENAFQIIEESIAINKESQRLLNDYIQINRVFQHTNTVKELLVYRSRLFPDNSSYVMELGVFLLKHGDTCGAKQMFINFLKLNKAIDIQIELIKILIDESEFAQAHEYITDLITQKHKNVINIRIESYDYFAWLLETCPEDEIKTLADWMYRNNFLEYAYHIYNKIVKKNNRDIEIVLQLGQILEDMNRLDEAINYLLYINK